MKVVEQKKRLMHALTKIKEYQFSSAANLHQQGTFEVINPHQFSDKCCIFLETGV